MMAYNGMTKSALVFRVSKWGFALIYVAGIAFMLTGSIPALATVKAELRWYGVLPIAAIGVALLACAKLEERSL